MDKKLNVAVIGAGYWGQKIIREYISAANERNDICLRKIFDSDKTKFSGIISENRIPENILANSYDEILQDREINAVHIAVPNGLHYRVAKKAIDADKHVVLEKPMAVSSRDAFRLAREAEKKNKVLLVDHIFRFNNALNLVKKMLENKEYGKILYLTLKWSAYIPPPENRDIIFDLAPHPVDIVNFLTEEWPISVYTEAKSYIRNKKGYEEMAFIIMELPGNITVNIELSWLDRGKKTRVVNIITEKASFNIDTLNQTLQIYNDIGKNSVAVEPNNTIKDMIFHFADRVISDTPPLNSATVGAMTVMVLEKMRVSLDQKLPMNILQGENNG